MRGHVEIVNALLQQGADRNIRNKQDSLPVRIDESAACAKAKRIDDRCAAFAQIDMCKPVWSMSWRYVQEVLAA